MAVKKWTWPWISSTETSVRKLIELLNLRLKQLAEALGTLGSVGDELNAVEAYLWNNGSQLVAGDSDWVFVPFDFTITLAEIVADSAGTITVDVYSSSYPTWDTWTKISASAPIVLAGQQKNHPPLTGWTTSFTGGTYLKFVVTGAPSLVRKATITLELSVPNALLSGGSAAATAGGVLSGEYPNPGFAEDMATQAELDALAASVDLSPYRTATDQDAIDAAEVSARNAGDASVEAYAVQRANHTGTQLAATISDFASSARAETEAELVAGTNVTITPSGSGATRQLTIASSGGGGSAITVKDEGSTLTATPASMNFTGAGVTATVDGSNNVTVSVPGATAGALVYLGSVIASGASSADFTSLISSTYDDYELVWGGVTAGTNDTVIGIQLSANNGSSWITSGYEYGSQQLGNSTNFSNYLRGTAQSLAAFSGSGFSSTNVGAGVTKLFRANTSARKAFVTEGVIGAGDGNIYGIFGSASYPTATTFNAIRVLAVSGTITGTFRLYGRAKA